MAITKTFSDGLSLANDCHDPFGSRSFLNTQFMRGFRNNWSGTYHVSMTAFAILRGFAATFAFPVYSAIGIVSLPVYAGVLTYKKYVKGDSGVQDKIATTLVAWLFCLIALGGAAGFLALSAFHLNLLQGTSLIITGCALSVSLHVYRALREPDPISIPSA